MGRRLPKISDRQKICIICEGNEEFYYLNRLKELKVQYEEIKRKTRDGVVYK